ncbi:MAG: APC family permease [Alkalispirochaetaceae bacterium]
MSEQLRRELGLAGATIVGLGSILGTGVFVSLGIAAGITGPSVVLAVAMAAVVATANGLSSAQLAAAYPVSGGTYEYGYRLLHPAAGFAAGWMFLLAKSASAATAALGFSGYALTLLRPSASPQLSLLVALGTVILLTLIVAAGIRRTTVVNSVIVGITLFSLAAFILISVPFVDPSRFLPFFQPEEGRTASGALFYAAALSFVAYTGYGRIATLGEEVRDPQRTIPRAVVATLLMTMLIYVFVAAGGVGILGSRGMAVMTEQTGAPLEVAAGSVIGRPGRLILAVGAITATVGVILNLILGLSRVLLAMGRRGDMPLFLGRLRNNTPLPAVLTMGAVIAGIVLVGDIRLTWSFSAVTVLVYYAITNAAALALPSESRRFPRGIALFGLLGCLTLALFVDPEVLLTAAGVLIIGFLWFFIRKSSRR